MRERQYAHIKDSVLERGGRSTGGQQGAVQHGESVQASASSINDISAGRRGGLR
jgi:hypothetical protein